MKRYGTFLQLFVSFLFEEVCFRLLSGVSLPDTSMISVALICAVLSGILFLLFQLFDGSFHRHLVRLILLISAAFFSMQLCVYRMFGAYFEWNVLGTVGQVAAFGRETVNQILRNVKEILLLFVPFFLSLFLGKKAERAGWKGTLASFLVLILLSGGLGASLYFFTYDGKPLYQLPLSLNGTELTVRKLGVNGQFFADCYKTLSGSAPEEIVIEEPEPEPEPEDVPVEYGYNELAIDFDSLIENDTDSTLKQMDEAFASQHGTKQNEYTGMFKGKNLIYIMAESFNEIAVSKELTPTLYKMIHQGFDFTEYYSPTIYSTIGGECMELTGLHFTPSMLGIWKRGRNEFPMGLSTVFENLGYKTYAYHNSVYTFQERNVYLDAIGFDYFLGEGNGLEETTFVLQDADYTEGSNLLKASYTSLSEGDVGYVTTAFLRKGASYTLTETKTKTAYLGLKAPLTISVGNDGGISVTGVNEDSDFYALSQDQGTLTIKN
ncbi:MAG: sulfatase-like hydrolase/transferase, partial [Erysipelotrichaceae bacterium]|nr:sulfatase-like hydrolase/transferase [Erysipelotrichaceae bacterium]